MVVEASPQASCPLRHMEYGEEQAGTRGIRAKKRRKILKPGMWTEAPGLIWGLINGPETTSWSLTETAPPRSTGTNSRLDPAAPSQRWYPLPAPICSPGHPWGASFFQRASPLDTGPHTCLPKWVVLVLPPLTRGHRSPSFQPRLPWKPLVLEQNCCADASRELGCTPLSPPWAPQGPP